MNHLENLRTLRQAVAEQPEDELDLSSWRYDSRYDIDPPAQAPRCGTHFCIGGLAAVMPHFKAMGLEAGRSGQPLAPSLGFFDDEDEALNHFFKPYPGATCVGDDDAYHHIFSSWGSGAWDVEIREGWIAATGEEPNDKQLALARLDCAIAEWEKA